MMSLVCSIIIVITAFAIIFFDARYQKIPLWLVILNYVTLSLLVNPYLLIGLIVILVLKKFDRPIDIVYIVFLSICLLMRHDSRYLLCIMPMFIQIMTSRKEKISFMISIELSCIILTALEVIEVLT